MPMAPNGFVNLIWALPQFWCSFWLLKQYGIMRFAYSALLGGDWALHALPGMLRVPIDDTIRLRPPTAHSNSEGAESLKVPRSHDYGNV